MPFEKFDRKLLNLKPLAEREHDLKLDVMLKLDDEIPKFEHPTISAFLPEDSGNRYLLQYMWVWAAISYTNIRTATVLHLGKPHILIFSFMPIQ